MEIGKWIRAKLKEHYSRKTIQRCFPTTVLAKPRGQSNNRDKMSQNEDDVEEEDDNDEEEEIWQIEPDQCRTEELEKYDKQHFLIDPYRIMYMV